MSPLPLPFAIKACAAQDPPGIHKTDANCVRDLALGWINATDLCPACTRFLMAALDAHHGSPLPWHQAYVDRGGAS